MTQANAQALLAQLNKEHGTDGFKSIGHSEDKSNSIGMADSDQGRMLVIKNSLLNIAAQFPENEFVRSILIGGMCNQCDFMVQSKNERIDIVVSEIRELRTISNNTEIDLVQMERKVEWMQTLVDQRTEMELTRQACYDAYKLAVGKDYIKPSKNQSASVKKARRDANMTLLTVDAVLDAIEKDGTAKLTHSAFSEEAAFATHNAREDAAKAAKAAARK